MTSSFLGIDDFYQEEDRFNILKIGEFFTNQYRHYRWKVEFFRSKKGIFKVKLLFKHIFK